MNTDNTAALKHQLAIAIHGAESHISFAKVVEDFPFSKCGEKPAGVPHSAWELVEHMRIAQWDILEFSRDSSHKSPKFPEGYWPKSAVPEDEKTWRTSLSSFQNDGKELEALLDREDLFQPLSHGKGQTLLREVLVVANHNSYHLGQLAFLKRMLTGK